MRDHRPFRILTALVLLAAVLLVDPVPGAAAPSGSRPGPAASSEAGRWGDVAEEEPGVQDAPERSALWRHLRPARADEVLVELDPTPAAAVTITFDRPMDVASVEAAWRLLPAAGGRFSWRDDQVLRFDSDRLRGGAEYTLEVGGRGLDASPLEPFRQAFRSPPAPPLPVPAGPPCGILRSLGPQFTLTFDDWGTREQAGQILDVLAAADVRAYFFPATFWALENPDLVERMRAEGHVVGNHTYSHPFLTSLRPEAVRAEIASGMAGSGLFRPPYGARNAVVDQVACALGYRTVLWTVDPSDYLCQPAAVIADRVVRAAGPGGVAVLHIKGCSTAQALPAIIAGLRQRALL